MNARWKRPDGSLFPPSLFFLYLGVLLLMAGLHTGLLILSQKEHWPTLVQVVLPIVYWCLVAIGLTLFTRHKIVQTYDKPLQALTAAAEQVAQGDFSVYLPPVHTPDCYTYLDLMFLDFNKMVAELGSIETMRTDFVANVSHELKTPLAAIQSQAQLLCTPGLSADAQRVCTDTIIRHTQRLSTLITNILRLNKLESQQILPQCAPFDLARQLTECALVFEPVWEEKNIVFDAVLEERAILVADEELLALVWNNLLANAFKFTPPGGSVTLTQSHDDTHLIVQVADTGCGIPPEAQRHIFDRFYQGDTAHAAEGNGLGLALVRRVVELMDGEIRVDSQEGAGACFTVNLPLSHTKEAL